MIRHFDIKITDLIRDDVSHDLESCEQYSKETGKIIPICYDERNTQLKDGVAIKPHSTNIENGKIKRTDKSMDGSRLERTGECIPCWTDEELLDRYSKEDVLAIIEGLKKRYKLPITSSFGGQIKNFKEDKPTNNISAYIIEFQQQAQRYEECLKKSDAGGTEFYWTNEKDKPGEALKNRLKDYTDVKIATMNWREKSKGTYRILLLDKVKKLIRRTDELIKYIMIKCRGNKTTITLMAIAEEEE